MAALLLLQLYGCSWPGLRGPVGAPPTAGVSTRLAVFPIHNLSATPAPVSELDDKIAQSLRARGLTVIDARQLEPFLARHRVRYTGGIDAATATLARQELDVDTVLIATLYQYSLAGTPRLAIAMRLVGIDGAPKILWASSASRAGDEAPGLLDLGIVRKVEGLEPAVLGHLAASIERFLRAGGPRAIGCRRDPRFRPHSLYRSRAFSASGPRTVAVLPFLNHSSHHNAGEIVADQFLRQLEAAAAFDVLDPGVVRERMLSVRFIMNRGVSVAQARLLLELLRADAIVVGDVYDYDDGLSEANVAFSAQMLDGTSGRVLWRAVSYDRGDDGVFFFGLGRLATASDLACHMIGNIIDQLRRETSP